MASESELAAGLDIGSAQTRCVICLHEGNGIRLLGYGESESHGWVKGRLSDHSAITGSVRLAVREAERKAQTVIEGAVLGIGGGTVEGWNNRGVYEFARPREIDPGDLSYAVELASKLRLHEDRFLLQVVPQDFTVDGRAGFRNPRGAVCSRLEANVHIITTSANEHQSVVNAVHQAHLAVEETVFEPLAAAYASVVQEERARGVAVIDMGAHSTGLVVYDGEALLLAVTLPISSDHFTRDVAYGLTVSYEDAENLKKEYGCAVLGLT
ncbi:MAG: cell division protein FtsA, partial [Bryobacteraceae bacterium]